MADNDDDFVTIKPSASARGYTRMFGFHAWCPRPGRQPAACGEIVVTHTTVDGHDVWAVDSIDVGGPYQRRRIGTQLYEAAAREACRRGGRLASTYRLPGAHSHAFWQKQIAKGRAVTHENFITDRAGVRHDRPIYILRDCYVATLEGRRRFTRRR